MKFYLFLTKDQLNVQNLQTLQYYTFHTLELLQFPMVKFLNNQKHLIVDLKPLLGNNDVAPTLGQNEDTAEITQIKPIDL